MKIALSSPSVLDSRQVRLQHHIFMSEKAIRVALRRGIAHVESQRFTRSGPDTRLQKGSLPSTAFAKGCDVGRRAACQPFRRKNRHATGLQIAQIRFVGIPFDARGRILERDRNPLGPGNESLALVLVVPRRSDQNEVEARPIDGGIVPNT